MVHPYKNEIQSAQYGRAMARPYKKPIPTHLMFSTGYYVKRRKI